MGMSLLKIDGWEATRRIKRDPSTTPVDFDRLIDKIHAFAPPPLGS
jgi:CheY-like chemotaxis protein